MNDRRKIIGSMKQSDKGDANENKEMGANSEGRTGNKIAASKADKKSPSHTSSLKISANQSTAESTLRVNASQSFVKTTPNTTAPGREALTVTGFENDEVNDTDAHRLNSEGKMCIALFTEQSDLQAELIASLLETKLPNTVCEIVSDLEHVSPYTALLLVDCLGRPNAKLQKLGEPLQKLCGDTISAAVFNAEQSAACENLLDWPCIYGIFYTDTNTEQLVRGMKYVLDGDYWVPRRLLHHFFDKNRKAPVMNSRSVDQINLTKREIQILTLIRDGASNQDISRDLDLSEHTIKSHLYNTYRKIGVKNRMEAAAWARSITDQASLNASDNGKA